MEDIIFEELDITAVVGFDDEEGVFEGCIDEVEVLAVVEDGGMIGLDIGFVERHLEAPKRVETFICHKEETLVIE